VKVLHVLNHSLPHVDGYSVRTAHVLRAQRAGGLEPLALTSSRQEGGMSVTCEQIEGVPHYRTPLAAGALRGVQLLSRRMNEVIAEQRPQLIHAHTPGLWALPAALVAWHHRLPFVYEVRSCWEDAAVTSGKTHPGSARYRLTRGLDNWLMRRADAVLPISEGLAHEIALRGIPPGKVFVAPNVVDAESFTPQRRDTALAAEIGLPPEAVTIGFIGSLLESEGVEDLIAALPPIAERVPNVHLVVVGSGPSLASVHAAHRALAHPERVHLVGAVPMASIKRYYALLDVVVYPRHSTRNTERVTPLKPLEAMAMEKAVLVSDVGGLRELIDDTVGARFRTDDIDHLAQQCSALLRDPARRAAVGRAARERILATRTGSRLAAVYRQAYASLSNR
jgi:PEP-CTERM/exosortase A-associated glycosyltransferase